MQHDKSPAGVVIYADGACKGNPGPGGWGAILRWREHGALMRPQGTTGT